MNLKKKNRKFHTHTSAQKLSSKSCNLTSFYVKFEFLTFLRQNFLNCDRKTRQINAVGLKVTILVNTDSLLIKR